MDTVELPLLLSLLHALLNALLSLLPLLPLLSLLSEPELDRGLREGGGLLPPDSPFPPAGA